MWLHHPKQEPRRKGKVVHGTFASKATWVREGSPMTKGLDEAGVSHQEFIWSGGNSHRARTKAAEELAKRLRCDREHEPGVRQGLAHSSLYDDADVLRWVIEHVRA